MLCVRCFVSKGVNLGPLESLEELRADKVFEAAVANENGVVDALCGVLLLMCSTAAVGFPAQGDCLSI
jgi:hypothetical protein